MSIIRKSGGYRDSCSFQTATIIYDATWWFCEKFIDPHSRTVDQMIQAARSGRQNIAEGSRASATSSQTELRLLNVARASMEELLLDYEDFLRHRHLKLWPPDSNAATAVREVPRKFKKDRTDQADLTHLTDQERWELYVPWLGHNDPAIRSNAMICLIHQANYLLDQQIKALEKNFIEDGGYSEQLAAARLSKRKIENKNPTDQSDRTDQTDHKDLPPCPQCGKLMVLRTAQSGKNKGKQFLGCSAYPECKEVKNL